MDYSVQRQQSPNPGRALQSFRRPSPCSDGTADGHVAQALLVDKSRSCRECAVGQGTYTLQPLPTGGTRITFEYRWVRAPLADRLTAPVARAFIRRNKKLAMRRLADQLASAANIARSGE